MQGENAHDRFRKILIPLDGSPLAEAVLDQILPIAVRENSMVHTLFVSEGEAVEEGQVHLEKAAERLSAAGLEHQSHVLRGHPAREIVRIAEQLEVDLIAMSTHGRSGVDRWVHGSVTEQVLRHTSTPLFVVSSHSIGVGTPSKFKKILVPLSGSERSAAVLPWIVDLARADDSEIVLARCEWEGVQRPMLAVELQPERVAASLQPWRERLEAQGLRVSVLVKQGGAAHELLELAKHEDIDLIALSTHGRHGFSRLVEGSVTEKLLRHCQQPLLVVRAESGD
jgi:nucleotide-binding universal stress UspA family protein